MRLGGESMELLMTMKTGNREGPIGCIIIALLLCGAVPAWAQTTPSTPQQEQLKTNRGSDTLARAQTAKQQCINTCRARYRDCLSLKQIPSSECRGIYQDCARYTCNAGPAGRSSWPGFPS
jgi:hypothetical protein